MPDRVKLKGLLAKIETTYKTDSTPAPATDGIQVEENLWGSIEWGYLEENMRENAANAGMGRAVATAPEGRYAHITATVAVKGSGTTLATANRPELDVLLRIAAHSVTIDATASAENIVYAPRSSLFESATVYAYSSNALFRVVGCRAVLTNITFMPGQIIRATFDIWGVLISDPTEVALPSINYPQLGVQPPRVKAAGLTLDGYDPADFSSFTFEARTEVNPRPRGNDPEGHAGYEVVDWNPRFVAIVDKPALGTFNPYTYRRNGTLFAWDIGPIGSAQYNRVTLAGPAGRLVGAPHSESEKLAMMDLEVLCQNSDEATPDDAYELVFS